MRTLLTVFLVSLSLTLGFTAFAQEDHHAHHKAKTGFAPAGTWIYTPATSCDQLYSTHEYIPTDFAFDVVGQLECGEGEEKETYYLVYIKAKSRYPFGNVHAFKTEDVIVY